MEPKRPLALSSGTIGLAEAYVFQPESDRESPAIRVRLELGREG